MKITIACVGRLKEPYLKAAEDEYLKRLRGYRALGGKVDIVEHKSDEAMAASIPDHACLVVLDERGTTPSSAEFARDILQHELSHGGGRPVIFAIGGADGHAPELRKRATHVISFGRLTIAHRLVRVLVLEQLYRGFSILAGDPYHRGTRS